MKIQKKIGGIYIAEEKPVKLEVKIDLEQLKKRKDFTFYANAAGVTKSENDVYIDFMQLPPEENVVPSVRIYMSHVHADKLLDALQNVFSSFQKAKVDEENK